jgi:diguanylate cyclase (GGDEF)-like protein
MRSPDIGFRRSGNNLTVAQIALVGFGLLSPVLTFFLAVSTLSDGAKLIALVGLAVGYCGICFWSFRRSRVSSVVKTSSADETPVADGLDAISDAAEFFGASLKPVDLFRLVSNRVAQIVPISGAALFVESDDRRHLTVLQASGPNSDALSQTNVAVEAGLVGLAWVSGEVEIDADLQLEAQALRPEALTGMRSAAAIPLLHDGHVFSVLVVYSSDKIDKLPEPHSTLSAIGERIAPLLLSSMSFERSASNALTDKVTNLPNERAFYMVLENQLAESIRHRDDRPLSVLTIDIKNFADVNQQFGFATGDRMLAFTAKRLTSELRKMDFLARSSNDEFLLVLPTASEKFASEIIQRISESFADDPFVISEEEDIKVWLNFGWATFWQDGDTAEQLLRSARVRKQQAKAEEPSRVLWFPKEYVN